MLKKPISKLFLASSCALAFAMPAFAASIPVFNTGVDASGTPQADNSLELHYSLIPPSQTVGTPFIATSAGGFPIGPWLGDNAVSAWIAPTPGTNTRNGPSGLYTYRTTFDLTGFNQATAMLSGQWATDDPGIDILINGVSTGQTSPTFASFSAFSVTSGFLAGVNTLDFLVNNGSGPTGLRVELTGRAEAAGPTGPGQTVPEPGSLALVSLGLAGLGAVRRRNKNNARIAGL